jgi:hypothetical protein
MQTPKLSDVSFTYRLAGYPDPEIRTSTLGASLGSAFVESFTPADAAHCRCRSLGWWDANHAEYSAAYATLAAALEGGAL